MLLVSPFANFAYEPQFSSSLFLSLLCYTTKTEKLFRDYMPTISLVKTFSAGERVGVCNENPRFRSWLIIYPKESLGYQPMSTLFMCKLGRFSYKGLT